MQNVIPNNLRVKIKIYISLSTQIKILVHSVFQMFKKRKNVEKSIVFRQIRYKRRSKIKFISVIRRFHFSLFRTCSTMLIFGRLSAFPFFFSFSLFLFLFLQRMILSENEISKNSDELQSLCRESFFFFLQSVFCFSNYLRTRIPDLFHAREQNE